jgi:antitoxin VapB
MSDVARGGILPGSQPSGDVIIVTGWFCATSNNTFQAAPLPGVRKTMTVHINNQDVETLLSELMQLTGESRTEAMRKALNARRQELTVHSGPARRKSRLHAFLTDELWPRIPAEQLGKRLTKQAEEEILGYGEFGA